MKRISCTILAALLSFGIAFTAQAESKKVYRLSFAGYTYDRADIMKESIIPWIKELEKKSNGRLKITFFNPGSICAEPEIFDAIESGRVSMGIQNVNRNPGKLPYASSYVKGMLGSYSSQGSTAGLYDLYKNKPEFLDDYTKFNKFKFLFAVATPPSAVFSNKPFLKVDDMKGARILSPGVDGVSQANSIGARGIQMPPVDFYMSLQRGMAEGAIYILAGLKSFKLEEVATHVARVGLSGGVVSCVMNMDLFNSLPKDLQQLIEEHSANAGMQIAAKQDELDERMYALMKEKGITYTVFSAEERAKFADLCKGGYIKLNKETFASRKLDGEAIFNAAFEACTKANLAAEATSKAYK